MKSAAEELELEPVTDLDAIRSEWSELAESSGNVFWTWEFNEIWWRRFGGGRPLLVTACRRKDGSLAAIVPLYEAMARPVRVLRFIGHGSSSLTGPISAQGSRASAAAGMAAVLRSRLWPWDVLLAEGLPASEGWRERLGGRSWERTADPILRIEGMSWDDYLKTRSSNLRHQMRRRERTFARNHDVVFRLVEEPARLAEDFETMIRLHDARWDGRSKSLSGDHGQFHREFATVALERGWLRLWIMDVDGAPVAAWYGFRFGGTDWWRQQGRDPAWERESVGFVLLVRTLRAAFEDGVREYRFLPGDEAYKTRFATDVPEVETVALGRGLRGRSATIGAEFALAGPRRRAVGRWLTGIRRY